MRLLASGRARLVARPARRGARQPRPRVRAQPAQRRLDGRSTSSRAGTAARGARSSPGSSPRCGSTAHRVALLKPETYMNESGRSVAAAARFFKVEPDAILVVHDEVDLEVGRLQARLGGGLAGHNGLRSIAQALGTQDFLRLRIGVGRPGARRPAPARRLRALDFEPRRRRGGARRARGRRRRDARRRGPRGDAGALQLTT